MLMKQIGIGWVLLLFLMLQVSCSKSSDEHKTQKTNYQSASEQIKNLETIAARDSNFKKSDEFRRKMEKACIARAKQQSELETSDKTLIEYELAINSLRKYTVRLKKNPDYRQDKNFMAAVENEASKVRDCYGILQKSNLTSEEKEKFEQLTHQKL